MRYFTDFPKIRYGQDLVIHAPCRFAFQKIIIDRDYNMWDYIIRHDYTPQHVADAYYGDPHLDWIIFLANRVINPYFAWPLTNFELEAYIENKYGSLVVAGGIWVNHKDQDGVAINEFQYNALLGHTRETAYEHEHYLNNEKRKIKLIDADKAPKFKQDLEDFLIRENNQLSYYLQYNPKFSFST